MTSAPVDTQTLTKALAARKRKGDRSEFDYCPEVEQGLSNVSAPACAALQTHRKEPGWEARMRAVQARLRAPAHAAYRGLRARETAFIAARSQGEVAAGAIHRGDWAGFEDEVMDDDVRLLEALADGRGPRATPAARAAAERRLAVEYEAFLGAADERQSPIGGLYKGGVSASQAAWTAYRDAWLDLVRAAWPKASPDGVAKHLADARTKMLKCVAFYDSDQEDETLQKLCD